MKGKIESIQVIFAGVMSNIRQIKEEDSVKAPEVEYFVPDVLLPYKQVDPGRMTKLLLK
jgi:hypothetical protein